MQPRVSIVFVPRERFSFTQRSLLSVLENTPEPFELICVDGGSPAGIRRWLRDQASERGFELIRVDRYTSPNEARNLGLARASGEYVVFVDNDVTAEPGWLEPLVRCADETGAAIVSPLTLEGEAAEQKIHFAGGEVTIEEEDGQSANRHVKERMWHAQRRVASVASELERRPCSLCEFHAVLVRRSLFEAIGPFDEKMLNTREHLDFCLSTMAAGQSIWVEPESVVAYVPGRLQPRDVPFYMLRWSDDWERRSLQRFREKWELADDEFFQRRLNRLGWRRQRALLHPLAQRAAVRGRGGHRVERVLKGPEHLLNRLVTARHARQRAKTAA